MLKRLIPLTLVAIAMVYSANSRQDSRKLENVLRLNMTQDPSTLDPRKSSDQFSSAIHFQLYEGLTRITRESSWDWGVAKDVTISEDMRTYTFKLKDAFWSDSSLLTAYDFEFSWKESIRPDFLCPNAHMLYIIKNGEKIKMGQLSPAEFGVQALDDKTLKVELEHPAPYFLNMISFPVFFPVPRKLASINPKWSKTDHPPANGPFFCDQYHAAKEIVLKKNPYYWAKKEVKPDEVRIHLIQDETTALHLFEQKELDLIGGPFTLVPVDSITNLKKQDLFKKKDLALTVFTTFNVHAFPFNNTNIRQAFSYAIDRESIVENVTQNNEIAAKSFIPPILKRSAADHPISFNPSLAKEFLKKGLEELNISHIGKLTYQYPIFGCHDRIAQSLQQNFKDVLGVEVQLEGVEFKTFLNKLQNKQYQFGQFLWIAMYTDPYSILERFKNPSNFRNYPGWKNTLYAELLEQSQFTKDPIKRDDLLDKAENAIINDAPLTPIFHGNYCFMENDNIHGFYLSPIGSPHLQWIEFEKSKH
jgi:oligopeptide transport system substrate-binding protein